MHEYRTALAVPTYNRAAYFLATITALAGADWTGVQDTWVFVDGPTSDADVQAQATMRGLLRQILPGVQLHVWGEHLGPDIALPRMHRALFDQGYDAVLQVEDDLIVAPYALQALQALHDGAVVAAKTDLIMPTLHAWCAEGREWKRSRLHDVQMTPANVPSYLCTLLTRPVFEATRAPVDAYLATLARVDSRDVPRPAVRGLIAEILGWPALPPLMDWATSYDGVLGAACYAAGVWAVQPTVNHGVYIGRVGAHDNTRIFEQYGAGDMHLDLFPGVVAALAEPRLPERVLEVW